MLGCCQVLWEEMVTTSGRVVYVAEIYNVFCRLLQVVHSNLFGTYFWNISTSTLPTFTRSSKIVSIVSTFLCLVGNSIPCSGSIYWGGQKLFLLVVITEQTQNLGAVQHIKHSNLILYVCKTGSSACPKWSSVKTVWSRCSPCCCVFCHHIYVYDPTRFI